MSNNAFTDRRQALENKFFQDQESKKISQLRDQLAAKKDAAALRTAAGIDDTELLTALVEQGVGVCDLSALALIPLVRIAWADGIISDSERSAVLEAAHKQGIEKDGHSHELLEAWLETPPKSELYEAWQAYLETLLQNLGPAQSTVLKDSILGLAHDVASVAGGILGLGSISSAEKAVLTAIGDAFDK